MAEVALGNTVPAPVEALALRLLAPDIGDRPARAEDVIREIDEVVSQLRSLSLAVTPIPPPSASLHDDVTEEAPRRPRPRPRPIPPPPPGRRCRA